MLFLCSDILGTAELTTTVTGGGRLPTVHSFPLLLREIMVQNCFFGICEYELGGSAIDDLRSGPGGCHGTQ